MSVPIRQRRRSFRLTPTSTRDLLVWLAVVAVLAFLAKRWM
jgi:hypothetical protein